MATPHPRLLIYSGKGGVGKTTLAVAMGLRAAAQGLNTLLCEVGENEKIAPFFGVEAAGYREKPLGIDRLSAIYINPNESFNEYVRRHLKLEVLWRPVVESKLLRAFVQAAPGLKELMTLGKIMDLERTRDARGRPKYDLLILDAPATGHGLSLFRSPFLAMRATRAGPVYHSAKLIADLLQDPLRSRLHIVTLAEEMPVNETVDMIAAIRHDLHIPLGEVIVNAVAPSVTEPEREALMSALRQAKDQEAVRGCWGEGVLGPLLAAADQMEGRHRLNAQHLQRLRERIDLPSRTLPFIFDAPWSVACVQSLAEALG